MLPAPRRIAIDLILSYAEMRPNTPTVSAFHLPVNIGNHQRPARADHLPRFMLRGNGFRKSLAVTLVLQMRAEVGRLIKTGKMRIVKRRSRCVNQWPIQCVSATPARNALNHMEAETATIADQARTIPAKSRALETKMPASS